MSSSSTTDVSEEGGRDGPPQCLCEGACSKEGKGDELIEVKREDPFPQKRPSKRQKKEKIEDDLPKKLSEGQIELIAKLVQYQDHFEAFSRDHLKSVPHLHRYKEEEIRDQRHLEEVIAKERWLIGVFFHRMPGNALIPKKDQTPMLRACTNGLMLLRWARSYVPSSDYVRLLPLPCSPYTRLQFLRAGYHADPVFNFFKRVDNLRMDDGEYVLMLAVVAFSVCPGLRKPEEIQKYYKLHMRALRDLASHKSPQRVWELQSTLNDLRDIARKWTLTTRR